MNTVKLIDRGAFKDLVTKFFYKENHLCFQILLHSEGDNLVPFQEFEDYGEYKRVLEKLLLAKENVSV